MKKQGRTIDPSVKLEVVPMIKEQGLGIRHVSQSVEFYNRIRQHSTLGYKSPMQYRDHWQSEANQEMMAA